MIFTELDVEGAFVVELERKQDERGFFARAFCTDEFAAHGLDPKVVQANISSNESRGIVRGLHWQEPPEHEAKTIRCIAGASSTSSSTCAVARRRTAAGPASSSPARTSGRSTSPRVARTGT